MHEKIVAQAGLLGSVAMAVALAASGDVLNAIGIAAAALSSAGVVFKSA